VLNLTNIYKTDILAYDDTATLNNFIQKSVQAKTTPSLPS